MNEYHKLYKVDLEHKGLCYIVAKSISDIEEKYANNQILEITCLASMERFGIFHELIILE